VRDGDSRRSGPTDVDGEDRGVVVVVCVRCKLDQCTKVERDSPTSILEAWRRRSPDVSSLPDRDQPE
jgi:hypothetical protein